MCNISHMKIYQKGKRKKFQYISTHKNVVSSPEWILENGLRASIEKKMNKHDIVNIFS
jgi:hypothetical protein